MPGSHEEHEDHMKSMKEPNGNDMNEGTTSQTPHSPLGTPHSPLATRHSGRIWDPRIEWRNRDITETGGC